jgi:hypothetical protein
MRLLKAVPPTGACGESVVSVRCGRASRRSYRDLRRGHCGFAVWSRLASLLQWAFGEGMAAAECRDSVRRSDPGAFERNRWAPAFAGATLVRMRAPVTREIADGPGSRKLSESKLPESTKAPGGAFVVDQAAMVGLAALTAPARCFRDCAVRCRGGGYWPATTFTISRHLVE